MKRRHDQQFISFIKQNHFLRSVCYTIQKHKAMDIMPICMEKTVCLRIPNSFQAHRGFSMRLTWLRIFFLFFYLL